MFTGDFQPKGGQICPDRPARACIRDAGDTVKIG